MFRAVLVHLRAQWMGALALFLVIAGGTAYAANTVFSTDIVNPAWPYRAGRLMYRNLSHLRRSV